MPLLRYNVPSGPTADANWGARAGDLDWSCWETGAHIADDLFSYSLQVIAQPTRGYLPIEARIEARATPGELLESIIMCGGLLGLAVSSRRRRPGPTIHTETRTQKLRGYGRRGGSCARSRHRPWTERCLGPT